MIGMPGSRLNASLLLITMRRLIDAIPIPTQLFNFTTLALGFQPFEGRGVRWSGFKAWFWGLNRLSDELH